jgi:hypothetical protein
MNEQLNVWLIYLPPWYFVRAIVMDIHISAGGLQKVPLKQLKSLSLVFTRIRDSLLWTYFTCVLNASRIYGSENCFERKLYVRMKHTLNVQYDFR